jgi:hypothetical protein
LRGIFDEKHARSEYVRINEGCFFWEHFAVKALAGN